MNVTFPQSGERLPRWFQQPLPLLALAAGSGIVAERWLSAPWLAWLMLALACLLVWGWLFARRSNRSAAVCLLLATLAVMALWSGVRWRWFDRDDIGLFVRGRSQPIVLEAVVVGGPHRAPAEPHDPLYAFQRGDTTQLIVRVESVRDGRAWRRAAGDARLEVDGHLIGVAPGDRLLVRALAYRPGGSENPGEFDGGAQARAERRLCRLSAESPECVQTLSRGSPWSWRRQLAHTRLAADRTLWRRLDGPQAALASAMLLGERQQLERSRVEAFVETGSVHLLVISGLHVGILVLGFFGLAYVLHWPRRATLWAALVLVIGYALLTDCRPPVMRAAALAVVGCAARLMGRRALDTNTLAAAALLVLVMNPADLFRPGVQLSFLAVATLVGLAQRSALSMVNDPLDRLIQQTRPWPWRVARRGGRQVSEVLAASTAVWLTALPLVASQFHLCSPIAVAIFPLAVWPLTAALLSGLGVLVSEPLLPPVAAACGWICQYSLLALEGLIDCAHALPLGGWWTAGPSPWWLAAFYAPLALLACRRRGAPWLLPLGALAALWTAGWVWGVDRYAWNSPASSERPLVCTFVSVGHGTCVLVELPGGETLLYDCGSLGGPNTAARKAAAVLWSRGVARLDAVVLSHADLDHYNGLPRLLRQFSVDRVFVSPLMFDEATPALDALREAIETSSAQLATIDQRSPLRLALSDDVRLDILHPPPKGVLGSDNANSIVLSIEYRGRRILLPGDLESPGLDDLLAEAPLDCDVVMAPHHGSANSNPRGFAAWSRPRWVIVSGGHSTDIGPVREAYGDAGAEVLATSEVGAVQVVVDSDDVRVRAWRLHRW